MARVPYPKLEDLPENVRTAAEKLPALNIMRMFLNAPTNAIPLLSFGQSILTQQELDDTGSENSLSSVSRISQVRTTSGRSMSHWPKRPA